MIVTFLFLPDTVEHLCSSVLLHELFEKTDLVSGLNEDLVVHVLHSANLGVCVSVLARDQLELARCQLFAVESTHKLSLVKFLL